MSATQIYAALTQTPDWLNTSRALTADDLKGRILLVDFWTYCCINCIHVIPKLQELEAEFGDQLTVIGVHSAKFATEGDSANIAQAMQKYGIEHPVVNDADFRVWNTFGVNAWPTVLLIDANGVLKQIYRGEGDLDAMRADIKQLIAKQGGKLVTAKLPIALEKNKVPPTYLRFPSKLAVLDGNQIIISDSGRHRIVIANRKTGQATHVMGDGAAGFVDGTFAAAQFREPQGVLADGDVMFVADTGNHRLRMIDLKTKTVSTLAGTGARGGSNIANGADAAKTALASPWDLAFYPDRNHIIIANAGTHQLLSYDRAAKTLRVVAGNGRENIDDGAYPNNSLSQPSGLSALDGKLYFVDAETSSLRVFDGKTVTTLIGTGLFDFGLHDGDRKTALMQHAIGVAATSDGIYIADTYNHVMRLYKDGALSTLPLADLREPNDIERVDDVFYIADTNHHRIVKMNASGQFLGVFDVKPMAKAVQYDAALPGVFAKGERKAITAAAVKIDLPKGWHINDAAPSYLAAFDADRQALHSWDRAALAKGNLTLPPNAGFLQGVLYYCQDAAGSQCLIGGVDLSLAIGDDGAANVTPDPADQTMTYLSNEKPERIAKVMAASGLCSRRDAEQWIADGRVQLNGKILLTPAQTVTAGDSIKVDGKMLKRKANTRLWLFHKPVGIMTTAKDPEGRPTVFELLPARMGRVVSVGRLDLNSEGLLLLTNDGGLSRAMELPATALAREYEVRVMGQISPELFAPLRDGITVEGVNYRGITVEMQTKRQTSLNSWLRVTLHEGKNREIRRVMQHLGLHVSRLVRTAYGPFKLGELREGQVLEVDPQVLRRFCQSIGYAF